MTTRPMPFAWTVNPYCGCELACRYCFARYTHEFLGLSDHEAFERRIYVKGEAAREVPGLLLSITMKSTLVARDAGLPQEIATASEVAPRPDLASSPCGHWPTTAWPRASSSCRSCRV